MEKSPRKCPTKEQLSDFYDHESESKETIETHLKSCPDCRKYLESLKQIDSAIKQTVEQETGNDSEISNKILERVNHSMKNENSASQRPFIFKPVIWRVAILLLIGFCIGFLLWRDSKKSEPEKVPQPGLQKSAHVPASLSAVLPNNQSFITIQHVWNIPVKSKSPVVLLKTMNILESSIRLNGKQWEFSMNLTKAQYEELIKNCIAAGYQLKSGKPDFQGDKTVRYKACFIEE